MSLNEKESKKEKAKALIFGAAFLEERAPVVAIIFDEKTSENAKGVIEGLEVLGVHIVMAKKDKSVGKVKEDNMGAHLVSEEKEALSAADIALVFAPETVALARKNGCVPVAPYINDKTTITYNPVQEKGNGFYFKNESKWEIFAAVVRALETFQFPYDWENVVKAAKK